MRENKQKVLVNCNIHHAIVRDIYMWRVKQRQSTTLFATLYFNVANI
jgi:hypothetical protein